MHVYLVALDSSHHGTLGLRIVFNAILFCCRLSRVVSSRTVEHGIYG